MAQGWKVKTKRHGWECAEWLRRTSVTAGTVMHGGKLPLRTWFQAVHLLTSHLDGINADQAQAQFGTRSFNTAWLLTTKFSRAMVAPDRTLLRNSTGGEETESPRRSEHNRLRATASRTAARY